MATKEVKRATVYLDADLHRAVKIKAGLSSVTISELISEAIRDSLREDASDIAALESAGVVVVQSPAEMGRTIKTLL